MRHIEVGLIIGGVMLLVATALALVWWVLSNLVGPVVATVTIGTITVAVILIITIDWLTERKETK